MKNYSNCTENNRKKTTENITVAVPKTTKMYRKHYSKSVIVPNTTEKYQKQQKSTENNRKVPKTTEKYRKHYNKSVTEPKTTEKYQQHYRN